MDDLISRQAAIDAIRKIYDSVGILGEKWAVDKCQMAIKDLPSAEPAKVCIAKTTLSEEQIREAVEKTKNGIIQVFSSAQTEIKPISYQDCANAMMMMWMDNVLTDGEYRRIMDKLNDHESRKENR